MRSVAITLDGVLRKSKDNTAQDMGGLLLYMSLIEQFRVVVLGGYNEALDNQFLTINGMIKHVKVEQLMESDAPSLVGQKRAQLNRLRAEGFKFEFVVVPDPDLATQLYSTGVPVLLYLHPQFSSESFRPDYVGGIKAWNELEAEVDYQVTARAEKNKQEALK